MRKGLFLTIEGWDGSGKTTACTSVIERLTQEGYDVMYSREPGGSDIAEQIRKVILDVKNTAMDVRTEALLYIFVSLFYYAFVYYSTIYFLHVCANLL